MTQEFTHQTYLSPFTWRYGSAEMRQVWSEVHKRRVWRRLWVALAAAQQAAGLVDPAQVEDLRAHAETIDLERAHEIEAEIQHDLMAEVKTFAEQCPLGGGIIHLGATSMDIEDNADALRLRESLDLILVKLTQLLQELAGQIERWATTPAMAFTHLQPAEPTTLGYRLAQYGFDLLVDLAELRRVRAGIRGKGFKGAVGTSASYQDLLSSPLPAPREKGNSEELKGTQGNLESSQPPPDSPQVLLSNRERGNSEELKGTQGNLEPSQPPPDSPQALLSNQVGQNTAPWSAAQLEAQIMAAVELEPFPVATQTYPRKQDWLVLNALAGLAGSLYKFAFDLRLLQAPSLGEWAEPFGAKQVGSSAMPFKRNPINAENIDSLARFVAALPRLAWDNAAHSLLERTLDDSANRREMFPAVFLASDEILRRAIRLVRGLRVDEAALARNLEKYGTFAATERILMAAVKAGADRQTMHEVIREHSLAAWAELAAGRPNPLPAYLANDPRITAYLAPTQILSLLDASQYVGDAPERARNLASQIRTTLESVST